MSSPGFSPMMKTRQRLYVEIWKPSFISMDGIVIAASSLYWTDAFGAKSRWDGICAAELTTIIAITDGSQALSMTVKVLMSMSQSTRCLIEQNPHLLFLKCCNT